MPTVYLAQSLLFLVLLSFLVFQGTEVNEVPQLLLRAAIFLVGTLFTLATAALGLARGGAPGRLRRIYGSVAFLFIIAMFSLQLSRAMATFPEVRRVRRWMEWFIPLDNWRAWWDKAPGIIHEFEYLVLTLLILLLLAIGLAISLRRGLRRSAEIHPEEVS